MCSILEAELRHTLVDGRRGTCQRGGPRRARHTLVFRVLLRSVSTHRSREKEPSGRAKVTRPGDACELPHGRGHGQSSTNQQMHTTKMKTIKSVRIGLNHTAESLDKLLPTNDVH